jgi:hypothetical protein
VAGGRVGPPATAGQLSGKTLVPDLDLAGPARGFGAGSLAAVQTGGVTG